MNFQERDFFNGSEKKALELHVRRRIYRLVEKYAGSHFREIERKSNLPTGHIRYHLSYLVKIGLINEERDHNNLRYFPREFKSENKLLLGLLRQKKIRGILLFILTHPHCNHSDIVSMGNISPSTVSWHIKKLEDAGVVGSNRNGRKTYYHILVNKEEIIGLLIKYQESFLDSLVDSVIEMWE